MIAAPLAPTGNTMTARKAAFLEFPTGSEAVEFHRRLRHADPAPRVEALRFASMNHASPGRPAGSEAGG